MLEKELKIFEFRKLFLNQIADIKQIFYLKNSKVKKKNSFYLINLNSEEIYPFIKIINFLQLNNIIHK